MRANESIIHIENSFALRTFSKEESGSILLCFPFVGGNSAHFRPLAQRLPKGVRVMAVDPPGHGVARGRLMGEIDTLVEFYYNNLLKYFDKDFYILGHSLGGFLGYLIAAKLEKVGIYPKRVFISAAFSPDVVIEERDIYKDTINEKRVRESLDEMGGRYRLMAENKSLLFLAHMSVIHSDYKLFLSYTKDGHEVLKSPVSIIYSEDDDVVESKYIPRWGKYCENIEYLKIEGDHNYIVTRPDGFAQIIAGRLGLSL